MSANPTGPLTSVTRATPCSATRSRGCSRRPGWTVEREYYFNDAGGQMDRFGASVEARYLQRSGARRRCPRTATTATTSPSYAARHPRDARAPRSPTCPPEERFVRCAREGADGCLRWIRATLDAVRRARSTSTCPRRRSRRRVRSRQAIDRLRAAGKVYEADGAVVVPLDRLRRRQGSRRDPLERAAHVLRRGLRLPGRQVPPRVRPPDLRLGRRPPRRRRPREGRRRGARATTPTRSSS